MPNSETIRVNPKILEIATASADGLVKLPLNKQGNLTTETPFAHIVFRQRNHSGPHAIRFERVEKDANAKFLIEYIGGPLEGLVGHTCTVWPCRSSSSDR